MNKDLSKLVRTTFGMHHVAWLRWVCAMLSVSAFAACACAEVPNRTPEQLQKQATTIVRGAVVDIHTSTKGKSETRYYSIKVFKCTKGDIKEGEVILVSTWHTSQLPGAVGANGHRGTPAIGETTTVYAASADRGTMPACILSVILPNGFQPGESISVLPEMLKDDAIAVAQLEQAADKAASAGAFREAELALTKVVAKEPTPARWVKLAASLRSELKFRQAHDAAVKAMDLFTKKGKGDGKSDQKSELSSNDVRGAYRLAFQSAFDADDEPAMVKLVLRVAEEENSAAGWQNATYSLEMMKGPQAEAAREKARTMVKQLGGVPGGTFAKP